MKNKNFSHFKSSLNFKTLFILLGFAWVPMVYNSCAGYEANQQILKSVDIDSNQVTDEPNEDTPNNSNNDPINDEAPDSNEFDNSDDGWLIVQDYNNGVVGEKAPFDAGGNSRYSDQVSLEGGQSCQMGINAGATGYGQWGGVISHPETLYEGDELWFRVYTYFPEGFDYFSYGEGGRLKFLRMHVENSQGDNRGYNDIYIDAKNAASAFKFIYEGEQRWVDLGEKSLLPKFNQWESYEFYVKFHHKSKDDGGEAVIRFWKNGKLIKEITNRKTLVDPTDSSGRTHIFTYWNGGSPKTQFMYIDNLVLSSKTPPDTDEFGNVFIGTGIYQQDMTK